MVSADGSEPTYVGRLGLTDAEGRRLLLDWRSPAAEPFFGATHANPMGLVSRRRYRWSRGRIRLIPAPVTDLQRILDGWLVEHAEGIACVIGHPTFAATGRVRSLTPELSKGLEFDLVILVDPQEWGDGVEAALDRYVAMTRATQQLAILTR